VIVTEVAISAVPRSDFGKGASRRLRRSGQVPAVIYGSGQDLVHIALPAHDLELALRKPRVVLAVTLEGKPRLTKPRDVQRDPVRRTIEHVDLIVIDQSEAQARSAMAEALHAAEVLAAEAGIDPAAAAAAVADAVAHGEDPNAAAAHAVQDVKDQAVAYAEANAREAEAPQAPAGETPASES
jgi:large subunit ribosomal protein L25